MPLAKVLPRGQLTLPRTIRRSLGIKPGDVVMLRATAPDTVELRVLPRLTLAEALERYRIEGPVDIAADRELWEAEAAKEVLRELDE